MISHRTCSILKSYKHILKHSFIKIGLPPYSTNAYKRNYYLPTLPTLPTSPTPITQLIAQTRKSALSIFPNISPANINFVFHLYYIVKRSISSLDTPKEVEQAERWLKKFTKEKIPRDLITFTFARSSGPGGQNVNKVNTKVDMRFNLDEATWIPQYAKKKLAIQEANRVNKKGELMITSDKYRSQLKNIEDCIDKLYEIVLKAAEIPKAPSEETLKRIEQLKRSEDNRRRNEKQYRSEKKSSRRIKDYD